jgi:hypothetical protein
LSPSVFLEKRKSLGTEHIYGIIHTKTYIFLLQFTHQKLLGGFLLQREVKPIAIKESKKQDGIWLL